jgi:hypothetical protein
MDIKNSPYVDKSNNEIMETSVENIAAGKALLEQNRFPAAVNTIVKLMTKALAQHEKATSSRRLASDAGLCRSNTASKV